MEFAYHFGFRFSNITLKCNQLTIVNDYAENLVLDYIQYSVDRETKQHSKTERRKAYTEYPYKTS